MLHPDSFNLLIDVGTFRGLKIEVMISSKLCQYVLCSSVTSSFRE
jgi:hypothetical protein